MGCHAGTVHNSVDLEGLSCPHFGGCTDAWRGLQWSHVLIGGCMGVGHWGVVRGMRAQEAYVRWSPSS